MVKLSSSEMSQVSMKQICELSVVISRSKASHLTYYPPCCCVKTIVVGRYQEAKRRESAVDQLPIDIEIVPLYL